MCMQCDLCWPCCVVYRGITCKLCRDSDHGGKGLFLGSGGAPSTSQSDNNLDQEVVGDQESVEELPRFHEMVHAPEANIIQRSHWF